MLYSICFNLLEQWSLTGGRQSSLAMSVFLIFRAWSICRTKADWSDSPRTNKQIINESILSECCHTDFPFTHSVAKELEAMADPQPNVLNFASVILPFSSTWIWKQHGCEQVWPLQYSMCNSCCWPPAHLKFHYVTAGRRTHQSSPHILGVFVQRAHVSRVFIMVHHLGGEVKNACYYSVLSHNQNELTSRKDH